MWIFYKEFRFLHSHTHKKKGFRQECVLLGVFICLLYILGQDVEKASEMLLLPSDEKCTEKNSLISKHNEKITQL